MSHSCSRSNPKYSSNFEKGDDFHLTVGYVTGLEIALSIIERKSIERIIKINRKPNPEEKYVMGR